MRRASSSSPRAYEDVGDLAHGDGDRADVAEALDRPAAPPRVRMRRASSSSPRAYEDVGDLARGRSRASRERRRMHAANSAILGTVAALRPVAAGQTAARPAQQERAQRAGIGAGCRPPRVGELVSARASKASTRATSPRRPAHRPARSSRRAARLASASSRASACSPKPAGLAMAWPAKSIARHRRHRRRRPRRPRPGARAGSARDRRRRGGGCRPPRPRPSNRSGRAASASARLGSDERRQPRSSSGMTAKAGGEWSTGPRTASSRPRADQLAPGAAADRRPPAPRAPARHRQLEQGRRAQQRAARRRRPARAACRARGSPGMPAPLARSAALPPSSHASISAKVAAASAAGTRRPAPACGPAGPAGPGLPCAIPAPAPAAPALGCSSASASARAAAGRRACRLGLAPAQLVLRRRRPAAAAAPHEPLRQILAALSSSVNGNRLVSSSRLSLRRRVERPQHRRQHRPLGVASPDAARRPRRPPGSARDRRPAAAPARPSAACAHGPASRSISASSSSRPRFGAHLSRPAFAVASSSRGRLVLLQRLGQSRQHAQRVVVLEHHRQAQVAAPVGDPCRQARLAEPAHAVQQHAGMLAVAARPAAPPAARAAARRTSPAAISLTASCALEQHPCRHGRAAAACASGLPPTSRPAALRPEPQPRQVPVAAQASRSAASRRVRPAVRPCPARRRPPPAAAGAPLPPPPASAALPSSSYSSLANAVAATSATEPSQPSTAGTPPSHQACVASEVRHPAGAASPSRRRRASGRPTRQQPRPVRAQRLDQRCRRGRPRRRPVVLQQQHRLGRPVGWPEGRQALSPGRTGAAPAWPRSSASRSASCSGSPLSSTSRSMPRCGSIASQDRPLLGLVVELDLAARRRGHERHPEPVCDRAAGPALGSPSRRTGAKPSVRIGGQEALLRRPAAPRARSAAPRRPRPAGPARAPRAEARGHRLPQLPQPALRAVQPAIQLPPQHQQSRPGAHPSPDPAGPAADSASP